MGELKRFQGSAFDTISRRKLIEDRGTPSLNSQARFSNYRMKLNCMNDSRDFQDAESVRSGQSHVASQPVFFSTCPRSWRNAKPFQWNASRNSGPPDIWDTHGISGNVFFQVQRRLLQHLIRKSQIHGALMYQNTHHRM